MLGVALLAKESVDKRFCVQILLKGERKGQLQLSEGRIWHARELQDGGFTCAFHLPSYVNLDGGHASYNEGILTVIFPTREEAKSRQVLIQSPESQLKKDSKQGMLKRSIVAAGPWKGTVFA